ncbi:MAG TPA: FG-GAP-like repeat-containing protein [Labilithrix sp.]|nr:FG-GAP-like repeat-containing protein [Labilithrix sp.]
MSSSSRSRSLSRGQSSALAALAVGVASCTGSPPAEPTESAPPAPSALASPATAQVAAPSTHTRVDGRGFPDKVIALTWDDGPDRNTLELASYLKRHRISATFFVVSAWIDGVSEEPGDGTGVFESGYEYLPILGDLVGLGHRVANHTLNHVVLREGAGATLIDHELRQNQQNIDPFLANELRLFRAPGGGWGSFGQSIVDKDPYLSRMVGPVAWDIDRKDWDESLHCRGPRGAFECERGGPGGSLRMKPSVVAARYVASIESAGHGIVLLHDRVGHVGSTYGLAVAQAMIPQLEARGYVFAGPLLSFSPLLPREHEGSLPLSDAHRWDPSTVRVGDVNGDGREDVCGRAAAGVTCAISVQSAGTADDRMPRTSFRAARRGPSSAAFATVPAGVIHLADVTGDGQADVCIAAEDGISCAASNVVGELGAFRSWSRDDHAGAFRFADVDGDGKADACSRTAQGISCARNLGGRFDEARAWLADMGDAQGWAAPRYASTVQLADVDGDGRADVCGRSPRGVLCALSTGKGFAKLDRWSQGAELADDGAWERDPAYAGSLRFGDLNGDGRDDVCAQAPQGIVCALSTGRGFTKTTVWVDAAAAKAQGWHDADLAQTIQLGDVNGDGRADLCGRGRDGIVCGLAP